MIERLGLAAQRHGLELHHRRDDKPLTQVNERYRTLRARPKPLDIGRIMFGAVVEVDVGTKDWKVAMALNLNISRTGDIAIVRCRGRIVFGEEADELRRVVLSLLKETKRIILNFAWVGHIDSSGLGTVVASFISARHHGAEIKFAALSPVAGQVLRTTHVDRLFEIYDSNEDAIESFRPRPKAAVG